MGFVPLVPGGGDIFARTIIPQAVQIKTQRGVGGVFESLPGIQAETNLQDGEFEAQIVIDFPALIIDDLTAMGMGGGDLIITELTLANQGGPFSAENAFQGTPPIFGLRSQSSAAACHH